MSFAPSTLMGYVDLLLQVEFLVPVPTPMAVVIIVGGLISLFLWILPGPISKFTRLGVISTALLAAAVGYDDTTDGGRWERAASYAWERATGEEWERTVECAGWNGYVAQMDDVAVRYESIQARYQDESFTDATARQLLRETNGLLYELEAISPPDAAGKLHEKMLETLRENQLEVHKYLDGGGFLPHRLKRLLYRHGSLIEQANATCA